ncbi:MAG: diguanylate cyclase, partial [archaeon]|nr:diguanylate cyclase [archaeon]
FHDPRFTRHLKTLSPEERNRVIGTYRGIRRLARVMREITAKSLTHHHQTPLVVNDSMFKARVYEALREPNHQPFSAIVIDLDRFGRINKRFGQKVGNVTLSRFTEMLSQVAAIGNGYAGRMGGDEYYLFFRKDPATAFTLIKMLQENYLRDTDSPEFRDEVMELSKRWRKGKQDQHWWKKLSKNMGLEFVKGLLAQRRWKPISFTAAVIGTSSYDKKVDYDDLFDELDRRMQKQKRRRRGKVVQIALNRSRKE